MAMAWVTELKRFAVDQEARGLSEKTVHQRVTFLMARGAEWETFEVSPLVVARFLADHSGWTKLTYYNHLTAMFKWRVEAGISATNPCAGMRKPPSPRPRPNPLSDPEITAVMAAVTGNDLAWFQLGRLAGLRAHEMAKLRGEDVTATSIYVMGKGGQGATVPTHPHLWDLAQTYPRNGWWFPSPHGNKDHVGASSVEQRVRKVFRSVGVEGGIHRTRANFGTSLLRSGANIRVVQDLMRHSSLASTEHYLLATDMERANAVAGLAA